MALSSSISNTITKTLLTKLPGELASRFSLNEDEVKTCLQDFLSSQLGKSKGKAKTHTGRTSGFILFSNAHRGDTTKALSADGSFEGKDAKGRLGLTGKSLGAQWKALSAQDRDDWNARAKAANVAKQAGAAVSMPAAPVEKAAPIVSAAPKKVKVASSSTPQKVSTKSVEKSAPVAVPAESGEKKMVKKILVKKKH